MIAKIKRLVNAKYESENGANTLLEQSALEVSQV